MAGWLAKGLGSAGRWAGEVWEVRGELPSWRCGGGGAERESGAGEMGACARGWCFPCRCK